MLNTERNTIIIQSSFKQLSRKVMLMQFKNNQYF
ncbi:unnamed protein product [Paramecium octaurelia]|uniref:Uncharacterized protein n=1 Tax=Paramecium octaurelia TaxID=43137 RepID=A0A8S1W879_PAROT|nr:unnamed protein product [Paramecium octaurelia]